MELSERISGLEARLTKPSAVEQCLLSALKLMEEGFSIAASGQLDALIETTKPAELTESLPLVCSVCFIVRRLDQLRILLQNNFGRDSEVIVEISDEIPQSFLILFKKISKNRITLIFSQYLSDSPTLEGQMNWLLWAMPLLILAAESDKVICGETFLNQYDAGVLPGLSYCANTKEFFLIPDNVFLPNQAYKNLKAHVASSIVDWQNRQRVAFWRGSTTGLVIPPKEGWRDLPRIRLCEISKEYPEYLDARITKIVQRPEFEIAEIYNSGFMGEYYSACDLQNFRYLIDIDGNTNAWGGLFERLISGSPVLKVESEAGFRQWYYDRLRSWHNFVPVMPDMSDLVSKIKWLLTHDDEAKMIGQNGRQLALSLEYDAELDAALDTISASFRAYSHVHGG